MYIIEFKRNVLSLNAKIIAIKATFSLYTTQFGRFYMSHNSIRCRNINRVVFPNNHTHVKQIAIQQRP